MQPLETVGHPIEVLIVSLASTHGLRTADEELLRSLIRAGVRATSVHARSPAPTRTLMLTDFSWAVAARSAAKSALAPLRRSPPRAIVYSSTTAALLWPWPGAIRFDACSAGNRPGRHGLWQRPLEGRRLGQASVLLPWSQGALDEAPQAAREGDRALILPVPIEPSGSLRRARDIAVITYAANPSKKGLDRVLAAWRRVRGEIPAGAPDELVVAGISNAQLRRAGVELAGEQGVRVAGVLPSADYRALVRRARVFVCAPRREDYGIAQLEALADGCLLVSTPAPGPYVALPIARALDSRLIGEDLESGLRTALLDPMPDYGAHARAALAQYRRDALDKRVADELLPRLFG
jgi:glycosyltransferase involved in cell wall biosynthesis